MRHIDYAVPQNGQCRGDLHPAAVVVATNCGKRVLCVCIRDQYISYNE